MDSILEAAKLSFKELKAIKLFNKLLLLVNSILKAIKLFDKALFLANSILEAIRLFGKVFFLINFTLKVIELSFKLKTIKLFKKFYFSNPALKVAKPSSEFCPQV
jgi:hypothetical protein